MPLNRNPENQQQSVTKTKSGFFFSKDERKDSAVSPVVGIMLMITITLILAAIISGMTGGIAQKQEKPPQLLFEASAYINPDTEKNSFFDIRIGSVSQGIPTRDLKLITEWKGTGLPNRTVITPSDMYPLGYNPGGSGSFKFGDYTLMAGTRLNANETVKESMDATLKNWTYIQDGTPIRIQFIHVPSGAVIADKEITAEA